tara:strand:- start:1740 stop:2906 length:1167 start_codon:yes stop_codon:yes gene_type:complete
MNASEITYQKTLLEWLETRPLRESATIALRAALRSVPMVFTPNGRSQSREQTADILVVLRALLTGVVVQNGLTPNLSEAADFVLAAFRSVDGVEHPVSAVKAALACALASQPATAHSAALWSVALIRSATEFNRSASAAFNAEDGARMVAWDAVRADAVLLENIENGFSGISIWQNTPNPLQIQWNETRALWSAPNSPYAFWLRWYEAVLRGETLNPELERDIALIPDEDWEKGADHIAAKIALVEERYDLKAQVVALKQQLTLQQSSIATAQHRSHNQPPELIDAGVTLQRQITIIFDTLDEAEEELAKTNPSPSRLKRIGQRLIDLAASVVKYCGKIADKGLVAAVVAGSTAAGTIGAAKLISHLNEVEIKGSAICKYAGKLLSGS